MTEKDWQELAAAYKAVNGDLGDEFVVAERIDTKHSSGAMSSIYKCGSTVIRIDIKENK